MPALRYLFALGLLTVAGGCKRTPTSVPDPVPAVTTLTPAPGPFNEKVSVTLATDVPATLFVTTDGSDPQEDRPERLTGPSPLTVELSRTTTLRFFSLSGEGTQEELREAHYPRAGGKIGTIFGVVVVDSVAVGKPLAVTGSGQSLELGTPAKPGEVPFVLTGLATGSYRLTAISDRNEDGAFLPFLDYSSAAATAVLDLADPYKASVEDLRLYLGTSVPGLGTIKGTITLPEPLSGQSLSISALSPDALGSGADMNALAAQLQNGYQLFTGGGKTEYPYVITDLEPGAYVAVPALIGMGSGGLAINFVANPFRSVNVAANEVAEANAGFGTVGISGTVRLTPATPASGVTYGIVVAKNLNFQQGLQAVLMPTVFLGGGGTLTGNYAGQALRSDTTFHLRVFTSLDAADPITAALQWVVSPFPTLPAHASIPVGTEDVVQDFTVP